METAQLACTLRRVQTSCAVSSISYLLEGMERSWIVLTLRSSECTCRPRSLSYSPEGTNFPSAHLYPPEGTSEPCSLHHTLRRVRARPLFSGDRGLTCTFFIRARLDTFCIFSFVIPKFSSNFLLQTLHLNCRRKPTAPRRG